MGQFYVQFNQSDEVKQSLIVLCIIYVLLYHKVPCNKNERSFS